MYRQFGSKEEIVFLKIYIRCVAEKKVLMYEPLTHEL